MKSMKMMGLSAGLTAGVLGITASAPGQVETLKNDTLEEGSSVNIQLGFVDQEFGGAVFRPEASMFPLQIMAVQIFWKSYFGSSTNNVQESIEVYTGSPPMAMSRIFGSAPPQLTDGFLNQFDFELENIVIEDPAVFTVGLRFSDAPDGDINQASLVTDVAGCQPGLNAVFALPAAGGCSSGWRDPAAWPVGCRPSGQFVIRVLVESVNQPCYADCDESEVLDFYDVLCYLNEFNAAGPSADCDESTSLDLFDLICFLNEFDEGCS